MSTRLRHLPGQAALKGCMRHVIVVKPPDRRFEEAVFILRSDYFLSEGADERELLRQAREAARAYTYTAAPARYRSWPFVLTALGLLAMLAVLLGGIYWGVI